MNWSTRIRQSHRWLSIAFTVLVIVNIILNFVAVGPEQLPLLVGMITLLLLAVLMLTGLYLFVLPYTTRQRGNEAPESQQ